MGDTSTWHLDIQQSRVLGKTPQGQAQSNLHVRPTMSSSNGHAWGLQENSSPQAGRHNRRLWGEASQPWIQATQEDAEHSMETWDVVQGQEECKTTKATNHNTKQSTSSTQSATTRTATAREKIHREEAKETRRDRNKQWAAAKQWTTTTHSNKHPTTKGISNNGRLLDSWRTSVEKSPHQTQNNTLHTTANARWTRCHKAYPREDNNRQANIRSKMVQNRRRLYNLTRSNFERPMDWPNKLWREHLIRGWGTWHGWRRSTTSQASKRTHSTSTANTTGKSRIWAYTPSI